MAVVRRVYELAAGGRTDREVGAATGLALKHVAEILTNPFYAGRLWSGEPSALGALVDPATWEHVQSLRARYSRRHRGGVNRRQYGLAGLLACASCGRRLTGHVGRYRHTDACEAFKAAAPRRVQRDGATLDPRVRGESYKVEVYEDAIRRAFEHVAVSSTLKASTVAIARRRELDSGDGIALARISRERDRAALRFAKDRDLGQLEATMARLDAEAQAAVVRPSRIPTAAEARAYLESLAGPVGEDLGRGPKDDRGGRVRADRCPGGDRLHVHPDRSREGAGLGRGLRSRRRRRQRRSFWSGREDLNLRLQRPERCALPGCATPRPGPHRTSRSRECQSGRAAVRCASWPRTRKWKPPGSRS